MKSFEVTGQPDRRVAETDRRRHADRRGSLAQEAHIPGSAGILRELLDEAHARIRVLERAVQTLREPV